MTAGEPGGDTRFRADLQGIRAIAVILIVLYHAGVTGLSGAGPSGPASPFPIATVTRAIRPTTP